MSSVKTLIIATVFLLLLLNCTVVLAAGEITEQPLSIKEDSGKLYVGYDSWKIRVFDSSDLKLLNTFTSQARFIASVETDDDNIYYGTDVSYTMNTSVITVITKEGQNVSSKEGTDFFLSILVNDGKFYDCQRYGDVEVRSVPDLKVLAKANNSGFCTSVRVDDNYIYSASEKRILVWGKGNLSKVAEITAHTGRIRALWDDNERIYSISDDNTLKIWNKTGFALLGTQNLKNPWTLTGHGNYLYTTSNRDIVALNRDGDIITTMNSGGASSVYNLYATDKALYAANDDGTVRAWDTKTFNNTVTSQVFQYTPAKYQQLGLIQIVSYALLAVGIVGFVAMTIRGRRKKKKAASAAAAIPPAGQSPAGPAGQP